MRVATSSEAGGGYYEHLEGIAVSAVGLLVAVGACSANGPEESPEVATQAAGTIVCPGGLFARPSAGDTSFFGCSESYTSAVTQADYNYIHVRANSYFKYLMGNPALPSGARDAYFSDPTRNTFVRLCGLRAAISSGLVTVEKVASKTVCGKAVPLYKLTGMYDASLSNAACGTSFAQWTMRHAGLVVDEIQDNLRRSRNFCTYNQFAPYFEGATWYNNNDMADVDPETAILDGNLGASSGATAAAHGEETGTATTVYRFGSSTLPAAGRASWVGDPCLNGTESGVAGTAVRKSVTYANPPTNTYLKCM